MSQDPSGIRLNYKYVAEKNDDGDKERGDRGEEVGYLTDDGGEHFVSSLIGIPRENEEHDPSGIRLQYQPKEEDGGKRDGGMRFLEPTLIRLPPAEGHRRENMTLSNIDDDNKKPAATAEPSSVSDHDVSPRTVVRALGEPVYRVQFPQADSPTGVHLSKYKLEMKASKNSHETAPPSAFDAASLGDPWPSSSSITTLPGAQWASLESERIKNETMGQVAARHQPMLRPHFVSSQATEPPLPGNVPLKSPPVLSASMKVAAAAAAPPTPTGPTNDNEDLRHVKASIRAQDKLNVKMKSVPTDNRVPFGPEFKDQTRGFNPIDREAGRIEDVNFHESSAGRPTFKHQTREEGAEEKIDNEAGDATSTDRGHGAISNGTTRLVQAELVIPTEAEVIEEKPLRKAWLVVLALLLTASILGTILGIKLGSPSDSTQQNPTGCDEAVELELGNFEKFRPADASTDSWGSCNISNPFGALAAEVGWYQFIGNDTNYTATTCGWESFTEWFYPDSQINVYSGIECQNLMCTSLVGSQSSEETRCNDGVSWRAGSGVQYWIQVLVFSLGGSFPITVFPTPPNQDCENAIKLEAGQAAVKGTTLGALVVPKDSFCGIDTVYNYSEGVPAVWYSVTGIDEDLTAVACSAFGNEISVYNGTCGNLTCIDGTDDSDFDTSMICSSLVGDSFSLTGVGWFAEAGMVYHIKVTDYDTAGTFELEIQVGKPQTLPPEPPPPNDNCEDAKLVGNELIVESTIWATPSGFHSEELIVCNGESFPSYHLSPDVWYQFNGTGEWHTATTCLGVDELDYFDSYLVIYSGTCSSLTCITSNDYSFSSDCSSNNAVVSWLTQEGETYLIRVSGTYEYVTGGFGLRIDDGKIESPPEPVNNHCENATLLELDQVVNGTTLGATPSWEMPACDQATYPPGWGIPDVWYHLRGTGDVLTVTTCTNTSLDDNGFDTYLTVYAGNCTSEMTCIAENDDDDRDSCSAYLSGVSWQSKLDEEYYVRVHGYDVTTNDYLPFGTFGIKAYSGTPDGNPPPGPDSTMPPY